MFCFFIEPSPSLKNIVKKKSKRILAYVLHFLITQFILTISLIPIYSFYGIVVSVLSFVGNIIFMPFLFVFVFLSLIFFIFSLANIIVNPIIFLLNKLVAFWLYIMAFGFYKSSMFISFPYHSWFYYVSCWPLAFFLIVNRLVKKSAVIYLACCVFSFCLIIVASRFIYTPDYAVIFDKFSPSHIAVVHRHKEGLCVFDYGNRKLTREKSENWLSYNLLPELNKIFGSQNVKYYFYKKENKDLDSAINEFLDIKPLKF